MTTEHRQAADQAMVMDAPRILRKDATLLTELLAKYQGLEGALNGVGQEDAAEAVSKLLVPVVEARAQLEAALEAIQQGNAPTVAGLTPEQSNAAVELSFNVEDRLMEFINERDQAPAAVVFKPEAWKLIEEAWPGRESVATPKGAVALEVATADQVAQLGEADFAFRF